MSNSAKPWEQSPTSTTLGDSHSSSTEASGRAPHRPSRASREIAGLTGDYSLTRSESSTSAPDADGNFFSVALDDFSIHGLVGEGEFGKVMMATKKDTGQLYAMKVLRKEHLLLRGKTSVAQAITEKQVLQEMSARPHPFIVSLCYAFQDLEHLFLVMDFVGGGDLFTLLEQKQRFPEAWVEVYAGEMVLALEHVHAANVIFRDLKPENVMVAMDGHLKLTDFGMSKRLGVGGERTGTICGTPEYLAPEVLQGMPYDGAVDWWTVGCLTYEMLTGQSPFKSGDMARMVQQIVRGVPRPPPAAPPRPPRAALPAHPPPRRTRRRSRSPHLALGGRALAHRRTARAEACAAPRLAAAADAAAPARRARLGGRRDQGPRFLREDGLARAVREKGGAALQAERAAQPEHGRRRIEPPGLRRLRRDRRRRRRNVAA